MYHFIKPPRLVHSFALSNNLYFVALNSFLSFFLLKFLVAGQAVRYVYCGTSLQISFCLFKFELAKLKKKTPGFKTLLILIARVVVTTSFPGSLLFPSPGAREGTGGRETLGTRL